MSCKENKNLLHAYVDGELDSAGSLSVESHIQRCESCLAEVASLRALASAIEHGALRFKAPKRLKTNVQTAIGVAAKPAARMSLFNSRWASALASAALIIAITWVGITHRATSSEEALLVN